MARPSKAHERREELLPPIAEAFSELGYRRSTTADLARRCGVQENILYRLWEDKKAMFLAAIEYLFHYRLEQVHRVLKELPEGRDALDALIEDVANNLGKVGLYRIIHAALGELHDAEIRATLAKMYEHYRGLVMKLLADRGDGSAPPGLVTNRDAAWGVMSLVTMMNLASELDLVGPRQRKQIFTRVARVVSGLEVE